MFFCCLWMFLGLSKRFWSFPDLFVCFWESGESASHPTLTVVREPQGFVNQNLLHKQKLHSRKGFKTWGFRFSLLFFFATTGNLAPDHILHHFLAHFGLKAWKIIEIRITINQKSTIIKIYPYSSPEKARTSFLFSFHDFMKNVIFYFFI